MSDHYSKKENNERRLVRKRKDKERNIKEQKAFIRLKQVYLRKLNRKDIYTDAEGRKFILIFSDIRACNVNEITRYFRDCPGSMLFNINIPESTWRISINGTWHIGVKIDDEK